MLCVSLKCVFLHDIDMHSDWTHHGMCEHMKPDREEDTKNQKPEIQMRIIGKE